MNAKELVPACWKGEEESERVRDYSGSLVVWCATRRQAPPCFSHTPGLVDHKRVLDFGSGGGLAAIAAAHLNATSVVALDVDPLASVAQQMNADLNGAQLDSQCVDACDSQPDVDVVLAGDVCYEREPAERTLGWLRELAQRGVLVLLADPGRHYAPRAGLELLATYDVPTLLELESVAHKRTRLWRLLPR